MKTLNLFKLTALSISLIFNIACSDDDDNATPNNDNGGNSETISEVISSNNELDSLEKALAKVGFDASLNGSGSFTIFAPSNQAFIQLLADNSAQSIEDLDNAFLTDLLLYHVSETKYESGDFSSNMYIESMNTSGPDSASLSIYINVDGSNVELNTQATVTTANLQASNGIVHIINNYMNQPTLLDFIKFDSRLDSLEKLVTNPNYNYETIFSGGIRTLFAPNNVAFENYLSENSYSSMNDIPITTVPSVMTYHYTGSQNIRSSEFQQGQEINTQQGNKLTVDLSNGIELITVSSSQGKVKVSSTDMQTTNGVMHIIDEVLLPF